MEIAIDLALHSSDVVAQARRTSSPPLPPLSLPTTNHVDVAIIAQNLEVVVVSERVNFGEVSFVSSTPDFVVACLLTAVFVAGWRLCSASPLEKVSQRGPQR